ncbi:MAG TPA: CsgG/HfaB family protein [Thermoanaerobaculia bacterium]|nr:CsgG/HfaB family protein [Thermoanaerobaculia bacterium]
MRTSVLSVTLLLLFMPFSLFAADPAIGVSEFRNDTSAGWWYGGVGRELAGMLSNELAATGKFRVVDREKLDRVLAEQDLSDAGRVNKATRVKSGKLTGAKYLVFATVTAFEENTSGGDGGVSFRGIRVGGKKQEAYIAVDLRVVDTTTGDIEFVRTVEARSEAKGMRLGLYRGGFGGNLAKHEKTPAGKAIRGVVLEIADYLTCAMVDQDDCMNEYDSKEKSRRDKTKRSIKLD